MITLQAATGDERVYILGPRKPPNKFQFADLVTRER